LEVSQKHNTTKVLQTFETDFYAESEGSLQALDSGGFLLGGGQIPAIVEYDAAGNVTWQARFEAEGLGRNYRTFRGDWSGTPKDWDPSLIVENGTAYVSWNGATDVEEWNVWVNDGLRGSARRKSFETVVKIDGLQEGECVRLGAVQGGQEVRLSNTVC
jgi:hypothetical protein